jgi:adenylyl- and sulfurtransferase ThiI
MYLLRYSEIALKSEPVRRRWEDVLITNIHKALPDCRIKRSGEGSGLRDQSIQRGSRRSSGLSLSQRLSIAALAI